MELGYIAYSHPSNTSKASIALHRHHRQYHISLRRDRTREQTSVWSYQEAELIAAEQDRALRKLYGYVRES